MNYSNIKETIDNRRFQLGDVAKVVGLSRAGFNLALKRGTLRIDHLEKISEFIGVPMVYWFQEEEIESKVATEKGSTNLKSEIKRLNSLIDDLTDDKRRLKRDNDELRGKLGMSKATG